MNAFRTIAGSPEYTMAATNRHGERKIRTTNKLISTGIPTRPIITTPPPA
ncbi:MAG: hypothetical protein ACLUO4_05340 [Christensenellales bacterium]